jgi:hypothetical protein
VCVILVPNVRHCSTSGVGICLHLLAVFDGVDELRPATLALASPHLRFNVMLYHLVPLEVEQEVRRLRSARVEGGRLEETLLCVLDISVPTVDIIVPKAQSKATPPRIGRGGHRL